MSDSLAQENRALPKLVKSLARIRVSLLAFSLGVAALWYLGNETIYQLVEVFKNVEQTAASGGGAVWTQAKFFAAMKTLMIPLLFLPLLWGVVIYLFGWVARSTTWAPENVGFRWRGVHTAHAERRRGLEQLLALFGYGALVVALGSVLGAPLFEFLEAQSFFGFSVEGGQSAHAARQLWFRTLERVALLTSAAAGLVALLCALAERALSRLLNEE